MPPDELSHVLRRWHDDPAGPREAPGRNKAELDSVVYRVTQAYGQRFAQVFGMAPDDMEDIASEAALRVIGALPTVERNLAGFMRLSVRNAVTDWRRRRRRWLDSESSENVLTQSAAVSRSDPVDSGRALRCLRLLERLVIHLGEENPAALLRAEAALWFIFHDPANETEVLVQELMTEQGIGRDAGYKRKARGQEWYEEFVLPRFAREHPECMRLVDELRSHSENQVHTEE